MKRQASRSYQLFNQVGSGVSLYPEWAMQTPCLSPQTRSTFRDLPLTTFLDALFVAVEEWLARILVIFVIDEAVERLALELGALSVVKLGRSHVEVCAILSSRQKMFDRYCYF